MECKNCKTECSDNANFCENCGSKLKETCDCWIKKEPYNCGKEKCPGYRLFKIEKYHWLSNLTASPQPKSITNCRKASAVKLYEIRDLYAPDKSIEYLFTTDNKTA